MAKSSLPNRIDVASFLDFGPGRKVTRDQLGEAQLRLIAEIMARGNLLHLQDEMLARVRELRRQAFHHNQRQRQERRA